jgi:hypothetical protein
MRLFFFFLLTVCFSSAQAAWVIRSDFQLQLSESLFDRIIEDFWQSLQGQQNLPIPDMVITPQGIPIRISGIRAELNYSFPLPQRVDERTRQWLLESSNLGGRLYVNHISATQTIIRVIDGITIRIPIQADCHNVVLSLPQGSTRVRAKVSAEVKDNQVKLAMPEYEAEWAAGAWTVESLQCSGIEGLDSIVREEALKALSSFQNFDAEVREAIAGNFAKWSEDASLLLLSNKQLPSGKDYVNIFYEPESAVENSAGLLLAGELRFEYPYVAPGQIIENVYSMKTRTLPNTVNREEAVPQLLLPFAAVRALMMGEYFAGKLEYSLRSYEIPAFQEFMQSRWKQFWAFPELQRFPTNTTFAFQFLPMGPPSFENEAAANDNMIQGDLTLPLAVRMFAPINGKYRPMVEFKTLVSGPTKLKLLKDGKIDFRLKANENPVTYAWSKKYVQKYEPSERIAIETISEAVREGLNTDGMTLDFPALIVGKSLRLVPERMNLEGSNLRMDFNVKK